MQLIWIKETDEVVDASVGAMRQTGLKFFLEALRATGVEKVRG